MAQGDGNDKQAARTTIVGGQPPGKTRPIATIPEGIERLLGIAAVDEELATELREDRARVLDETGIDLTPTERGVLAAIDDATLEAMIAQVERNLDDPARRSFLAMAANAALTLAGGAALASGLTACRDHPAPTGSRPDRPKVEEKKEALKTKTTPTSRPTATKPDPAMARPIGGLVVDKKKEDEEQVDEPKKHTPPVVTGSKPDRPEKRKTRGIRPDRPPRTKGIRPDRPSRSVGKGGVRAGRPKDDDIDNPF